jgi:undecaprenyl-diphosphatase
MTDAAARTTGVCLVLAAMALGALVTATGVPSFDRSLMLVLAEGRSTEAASFWQWATWLGDREVRIAVGAAMALALVVARGWRDAALFLGAVAAETAANSGLKLLFARPRPDLLQHLDVVTSLSFPSGHAAHSATLYLLGAVLLFGMGRGKWPALTLAAIIAGAVGLSRIVLGVHWPTDVIGGWASGAGFVLLALSVRRRLYQR